MKAHEMHQLSLIEMNVGSRVQFLDQDLNLLHWSNTLRFTDMGKGSWRLDTLALLMQLI